MPLLVLGCGGSVLAMDSLAFLTAAARGSQALAERLAHPPQRGGSFADRPAPHGVSGGAIHAAGLVAPAACVAALVAARKGAYYRVSPTRSRHVRNFFGGGDKESDEQLAEAAKENCEKLAAEVKEIKEEAEEKRASHERLKTEVSNYRARTRKELSAARGKAAIPIFKELLPIADEFDLAQQNLQLESDGERAIADRFKCLFENMLSSWKVLGVEKMQTLGEEFDPLQHEAISMIPSADYSADKVCNELRGGWQLKPVGTDEREVLRAALVCVSSGPGPS